jgi:peptide/nickel transport system substrate-binding protein
VLGAGQLGTAVAAAGPRRGGSLRVGVAGGSAADYIDGQNIAWRPEQARLVAGFESLLTRNARFELVHDGLAEEVSTSNGRVWTIRVRDGVEFHDGRTLSADDVIYSLRRLADPKVSFLAGSARSIDPNRITRLDRRTCRLVLRQVDSTFPDLIGEYVAGIVPVGYSPHAIGKARPNVGTGPYRLHSFIPGQQSVHDRNPNYWRAGQPYLDQVTIVDLPDPVARVNALLGGQVDAITDVPPALVRLVTGHASSQILESPSAAWIPVCVRVDVRPFDDVRVRQAFRLLIDRPQMVELALGGHGRVGNDLYAPFDAAYDGSLPQRRQDLEQARSLLKAAGQEGLRVELATSNAALGMLEAAYVFARQARAAGVEVTARNLDQGTFLGPGYLERACSMAWWGTRSYLLQVGTSCLPWAPSNETHWPADPRFTALYRSALTTLDPERRTRIIHEMQRIEYDSGGYAIWGFASLLDGHRAGVRGLHAGDRGVLPLNGFGRGFRLFWLA